MSTTLTCALAEWSPGIGDNTVVGWLTVLVYIAAAGAATKAALVRIGRDPLDRRERLFWWLSGALLLVLAVNKQLDLQTFVTAVGRCHAQLAGWYEGRREIQRLFILAVALTGVIGFATLAFSLRGILGRIWPALGGLGFVCLFVVIRAASFHKMDALIGSTVSGFRLNWLLELPGPILVLAVAMRRARQVPERSSTVITNHK
jgi:hypothetical protein